MTDNTKKFAELLSKDESVQKELDAMVSGLSKDDRKGFVDAAVNVAARHGITLTEEDFRTEKRKLSDDELEAVAGGGDNCDGWFEGRCAFIFLIFE